MLRNTSSGTDRPETILPVASPPILVNSKFEEK
jgi:hypothetical protein